MALKLELARIIAGSGARLYAPCTMQNPEKRRTYCYWDASATLMPSLLPERLEWILFREFCFQDRVGVGTGSTHSLAAPPPLASYTKDL